MSVIVNFVWRNRSRGSTVWQVILRQFLYPETACASYLFGCTTKRKLAVVDPHIHLVDSYLEAASAIGSPIVAVFETHVQADHVSGLPDLVERTGATAYFPPGAGVEFSHVALDDGAVVEVPAVADANTRAAPSRCSAR